MNRHRRSIPMMLLAILFASGVVGILLLNREDGPPTTVTVEKELAEANDRELDRFYRAAGSMPVWGDRRDEVVAALMGATTRGLPGDYLDGLTDVELTRGLIRYAHDLRFGRWNPGIYGQPEALSLGDLAWSVAQDPDGLEMGLRKLDPPFAEYARLEAALAAASPVNRHRIAQTMERWRWLPRSLPNGVILVNIPEFRLRALDENRSVALELRTIVGLLSLPTPLLSADLTYLVFGPYWNVPASILAAEILPDIVKDRSYLTRNGYEVLDAEGRVITTGNVSDEVLAGLRSGKLRVRQVPGPRNALGRVKFMFPNQDNAYLHDTPSRNLFAREQRALSHGCVRVENPQALAEWVLRNERNWPRERIETALKQTTPLQVNLKNPIPVYIVYHTVTVDEDGTVHYAKDLYGQEAVLAELMAATTDGPGQRPRE